MGHFFCYIVTIINGISFFRRLKNGGGDMSEKVSYRINFEKAVETILWISQRQPGIDIHHIGKTLFYAEKLHLNKYGRPIIGDIYMRGPYGPFPSTVRDMIQKKTKWIDLYRLSSVSEAFSVVNNPDPTPIPKRHPNFDFLSETDMECLEESIKTCGTMSFDQLKNISHEEPCYKSAVENEIIDYANMIDCSNPLRNEIIKEMEETHRYAVI
jgi:uncharacterized phage-associated protein